MFIIRLFKDIKYGTLLPQIANTVLLPGLELNSALATCVYICVFVCAPLLSPSAARWCPNGAGITTGDHKQQLCPVRPHSAAS